MPLGDRAKLAQASRSTAGSDVTAERLQGLLRDLISQQQVYHAIAAVESGDRSLRWFGAAGDANLDGLPMQADTPFFLASATKLYTAAVIMKLHERGRIGLDEPIATYLPQTLIGRLHRRGGVDYTDAITVRYLLSHTSGLPDYFEDRPKGGHSVAERLFSEGDMAWSTEDVVRIVRDQLTPHFAPQHAAAKRQKVRYSDTNYQLLGAIIEAVTAHLCTRYSRRSCFGHWTCGTPISLATLHRSNPRLRQRHCGSTTSRWTSPSRYARWEPTVDSSPQLRTALLFCGRCYAAGSSITP